VSDEFLFNADDHEAELSVSADNAGTPASGDIVNVAIAYTSGDILGDSGNDYATQEHAEPVAALDTWATNTPGEDPARLSVPLRMAPTGFKVVVQAPQGASRNIVVRARVVTRRYA
jgi:hypothetical protein